MCWIERLATSELIEMLRHSSNSALTRARLEIDAIHAEETHGLPKFNIVIVRDSQSARRFC
jgi:hypothetical protein